MTEHIIDLESTQEKIAPSITDEQTLLHSLASTQSTIQKIKEQLKQVLQAITHNPSLFSRAAVFWAGLPLWQKVLGGAGLILPLLLIGLFAHLAVLITLSVVAVLIYTAASLLLDNHQNNAVDATQELTLGMNTLVDLLDTVIATLDQLSKQLELDLASFQQENIRLTQHLDECAQLINTLTTQVNALTNTITALTHTQVDLEAQNTSLDASVEKQKQLLEATQNELAQAIADYEEQQQLLGARIQKLNELNMQLTQDAEQAQATGKVLAQITKGLSNTLLQGQEQCEAFQKRLEEFLANKEKHFAEILGVMGDTTRGLSQTTEELEQSQQQHRLIIDRHEQEVNRMGDLLLGASRKEGDSYLGVKPSVHGFYARPQGFNSEGTMAEVLKVSGTTPLAQQTTCCA